MRDDVASATKTRREVLASGMQGPSAIKETSQE
jgi:hypothetical protein